MGRAAKAVTPEQLKELQRAYQLCFGSPAGQMVLKDLMPFCRAAESTFDPDPRIHAVLEGRREVYLRIQDRMRLSTADLWALLGGGSLSSPKETEDAVDDPFMDA